MIIYNVTINVDDEIHDSWLNWMKSKHLNDVLETGMFSSYKMLKLLSKQSDEFGTTYAIQYYTPSMENYEKYQSDYAEKLQAEGKELFGGKFYAFRTLLEEI
ncbi:MAG: DUF4286 family protein [Bacteroidia bacterium]|jgi:hypothetical protein|nr:DUF4286 family protein [Bacteroidia bacterium]